MAVSTEREPRVVNTLTPHGVEWALLRDGAWKQARAASEYENWEAAQRVAGKAPRTVLHYAYTIWDLLEHHPEKEVQEFTSSDCEKLLLTYPQRSRGTRAAHLVSFFRFLYRKRRVIPENPMEFVELPKAPKRRLPNVFSEVDQAKLCGLDPPDGPLFVLMFECLLRKGECRKLKRSDINIDRAELYVRQSKGDKDRIVPLTLAAQQAVNTLDFLEGLTPEDHLWYIRPGGSRDRLQRRFVGDGMGDTTFSRWYKRCLEDAGVEYRKPHMTRHTGAYRWRLQGLAADELQIILGHASVQTTVDQYGHLSVNDVAKRMRELEGVA